MKRQKKYLISSNINDNTLTEKIIGKDQDSANILTKVICETSLTIFLNN